MIVSLVGPLVDKMIFSEFSERKNLIFSNDFGLCEISEHKEF